MEDDYAAAPEKPPRHLRWTKARPEGRPAATTHTTNDKDSMMGNRMFTIVLFAVSATLCSTAPAIATKLDGNWSMVAETTRGHCGTIEIGLVISGGRIFSSGGSFAFDPISLGGRVSASGYVRMNAVAGPRIAQGTGRFGQFRGSGTWAGRGPSGLCSGVWSANRS